MKRCNVCKLSATTRFLCNKCIEDPFRVEELRALLAEKTNLNDLKKTYRKGFAEIRDINSPEFWDKLLGESEEKEKEKQSPVTRDRIKTVAKMIGESQDKLLDAGFGYGLIEKYLNKKGIIFDLHGIDISQKAVKRLREVIYGNFRVGSILEIPFTDKFFDVVLALEILEHIPPSKTFKAINELYRVLKGGGILIASVPLNEGLEEMYRRGINPNGHVRVYTPELIKAELKIPGFKIQQEKYLFAFKNFYWFKDLLRKILLKSRWRPNNIIVLAVK